LWAQNSEAESALTSHHELVALEERPAGVDVDMRLLPHVNTELGPVTEYRNALRHTLADHTWDVGSRWRKNQPPATGDAETLLRRSLNRP
jgi:hypothetical protein